MRFKKQLYPEGADLTERVDMIKAIPDTVLAWFCNDNNRVYSKLKNEAKDFKDLQILNNKLTHLNTVVINEIEKMANEHGFDFWNTFDIFANMLMLPRLPVTHTTDENLIPKNVRDFINQEALIKERKAHERELLKASREAIKNLDKNTD